MYTIVYRFSTDRYLLAFNGALLSTHYERVDALNAQIHHANTTDQLYLFDSDSAIGYYAPSGIIAWEKVA